MICIILAAGMGKRMMPLTKEIPKTLLKLNGLSILNIIIKNCYKYGIVHFLIVVGYNKNAVMDECSKLNSYNLNIDFVENDLYDRSNTSYSLYLAVNKLINFNEDLLIINGDDVFDSNIINNLINVKGSAMVIDNVKKLTKESITVVKNINNTIINIGKNINSVDAIGEFIGISKIDKNDIDLFKNILYNYNIENLNQYYDLSFIELSKKTKISFYYTNKLKWTEIDTIEDFNYALKIIKKLN